MKKSQVAKRSIVVGGHKTSVSLEEPFWQGFKGHCLEETPDAVRVGGQHRYRTQIRQSIVSGALVRAQALSGARAERTRNTPVR
jgi:ribbon-helix-helix protein